MLPLAETTDLCSPTPRLQLANVTKVYPGVVANDDVCLCVQAGEIHAVLGENGAGKSTLMKIIYGAVAPNQGQMFFDGKLVQIHNPQEARALGIAMVFQHFSLFYSLTVAENVWLGLSKTLTLAEVCTQIIDVASAYGLSVDPLQPVHTLATGEMQRVEIIRALLTRPKLLILDEPTSVLTPQAVESLFNTLRQLAAEGCSILYISHKLHEIRALCHTCTVLRGGRVCGVCDPRQESNASLSKLMIGAALPALSARNPYAGANRIMLEVKQLSLARESPFASDLHDLSLQVRSGEIVGIAGISGNGQRELLFTLSGEDRRAPTDAVTIDGEAAGQLSPSRRRALGLHFVPEERLGRGTVPNLGLSQNLLLTRREAVGRFGWIRTKFLSKQTSDIIQQYGVKASGPQALAHSLSGGNLQKFILGREIGAKPQLLIVSQPTWGIDAHAAAQIRSNLLRLRNAGCAILLVSEELDELFELADRLYVMAKGRLSPSINRDQATIELVGEWMSGLWPTTQTDNAVTTRPQGEDHLPA